MGIVGRRKMLITSGSFLGVKEILQTHRHIQI